MGEFVKKTMMGYKEVPGGQSDPECTHVILTEAEYIKLLRQISDAEQNARTTVYPLARVGRRQQQDPGAGQRRR